MSDLPPTGSTQEISKALADISERAQTLIRDEIDLAKLEVTGKVKTIGKGAAVAIAAGVFLFFAIGLILIGLSYLAWYLLFPDETYFWGFFLVAGILIIIAGLAGWFAVRALQTKPTPDMAIAEAQRIRETIEHPVTPIPVPDVPAPAGPASGSTGFGGLSVPPVGSTEEFAAVSPTPGSVPPAAVPVDVPPVAEAPEAVPPVPPAADDDPQTPPADGAR